MDKRRGPARLVPPGRIIRRELEARGWQQKDLAQITGRPEQAISEIVNSKKRITAETARELASAFGTSTAFWINLESHYQLDLAKRQQTERAIERRAQLRMKAPYRELINRGWIEDQDSLAGKERELCRFLGISSLEEESRLALAARHSAHGAPEQAAQIAWARRAEQLAGQQSVPDLAHTPLMEAIPNLLILSTVERDVARVPETLLALGIHFVIVPHLPQTYLDGAALHLDGRPVVALTLRYDRLDSFWFTLMHELAHLVLGHPGIYLDRLDGDRIMSKEEEEADALAADWLVDPEAYKDFVERGRFGNTSVERFAREQHRHPGIIAGRLQHDGLVEHKRYVKFRVKVKGYLSGWIDVPRSH